MKHEEGTNVEIERRFLLEPSRRVPEASSSVRVIQWYLVVTNDSQVRVRIVDDSEYWLTVKRKAGADGYLMRLETEVRLNREQAEQLRAPLIGRLIAKTRSYVDLGDALTAEIDIFTGDLEGLHIVEVEFASFDESQAFIPPDWFGSEITDDAGYLNSSLALYGVPVE